MPVHISRRNISSQSEVAVVDALASRRIGISRVLEQYGFVVSEPAQPSVWLAQGSRRVGVVSLEVPGDLEVVRQLADGGRNRVVVLMGRSEIDERELHAQVLEADVTAAIPARVSPLSLAGVVSLALEDVRAVRSDLFSLGASSPARLHRHLSAEEQDWLRALRHGETIGMMAVSHGVSERTMFRRLAGFYRRLGVANRTEAVALAERLGIANNHDR
jgi:DNA-binding NarL/FixJ family response regulator